MRALTPQAARLRCRISGEAGPALVLVHGAGGSSLTWLRVLPALGRTARVFALDLPGHGRSSGAVSSRIADYREAVRGFVCSRGLERPVLAGHSMGGAIVLDYALAYPGEVAGLVLCSTSARFPIEPALLDLLEQGLAGFHRELARRAFGTAMASGQAEAAIRDLVAGPASVALADFRACMAFDVGPLLGSLRVPALIVGGELDRIVPPQLARELAASLAGSRLVLVPEVGHLPPWELPARVALEIGRFLHEL